MNRIAIALLSSVCITFVATGAAIAQGTPQVLVELDRSRAYEGQPVLYRVTLNHIESPSPPKLVGFDDFDVTLLREQPINSRSVTIINGHRTETVRYGHVYDYRLVPRRIGNLTIPGPIAMVDGRQIRGPDRTIRVIAPGEQDTIRMTITADHEMVYPTQPFTVTLTVEVKGLSENLNRNPMGVQSNPPALTIPWVNDKQLPEGLKPSTDWERWLGPMQNPSGTGFSINGIGGGSVFTLFDERLFAFSPRPKIVTRTDRDGNESMYWQYRFSRTFTSGNVGNYKFGPVTLKGMFAVGESDRSRLQGEEIYAVARPITISVRNVPEDGRPDSYIGAVGTFTWNARLMPTKTKVGDPITLTLTLKGIGSLDQAVAPDLKTISEIAKNFKVHDATQEIKNDAVQFTYTLRPLKVGVDSFPPIPASYFDVDSGRFVALKTEPISITVEKTNKLANHQILASNGRSSGRSKEIELHREGIFANVTDPTEVYDQSVNPSAWLLVLVALVFGYIMVAFVVLRHQCLHGDQSLVRRRLAVKKAKNRLKQGLAEFTSDNIAAGADQIRSAFIGLVADATGITEAGLTQKDVELKLCEINIDGKLVLRLAKTLEACDAARYGTFDISTDGFCSDVDGLFGDLIRSLKKKKLLR